MRRQWIGCLIVALLALTSQGAWSAEPESTARSKAQGETEAKADTDHGVRARTRRSKRSDASTPARAVELFAAIEAGEIEVKFVPKDAEQATVLIENRTDQPLQITLPAAFAAVPILAQPGGVVGGVGGVGNAGMLGNQQNQGGGNQALGGGFGGAGGGIGGIGGGLGGLGGGGLGGGLFNVAAQRTGKLRVTTVCLEHGKRDPTPRIPYAIKPIEQFTTKGEVIELCRMLGRGDIDQKSAQAAAWHLTSGLTWQQLAAKPKARYLNGSVELYFGAAHIQRGMLAATRAMQVAELERQAESTDSQTSLGRSDEP